MSIKAFPPTSHIFSLLSNLSSSPTAIPFFTGTPNLPIPHFFQTSLSNHLSLPHVHQYTRSYGIPELTSCISKMYSPFFQRKLDAMNEVLIIPGSQAGLFASIQALVNPGEVVIVFEPNEQKYREITKFHQGKVISIPLKEDLGIDYELLEEELSRNNVRLMIISSPQTPIGKIYNRNEINSLQELLKPYPEINILFDASYEKLILDPEVKVSSIIDNEFWKRSVTIFGADKAFMATGINLGWAVGPEEMLKKVRYVHNISTFCMFRPMQLALEEALWKAEEKYENEENYYRYIGKIMKGNMDKLLESMGKNEMFKSCPQSFHPQGGYSMMFDISKSKFSDLKNMDIMTCLGMGLQKEILMAPGSLFYNKKNKDLGEKYLKIDLCRSEEEVTKACGRLSKREDFM